MSTGIRLLIVAVAVVSISEGVTYYLVRRYGTLLVVIPIALGAIWSPAQGSAEPYRGQRGRVQRLLEASGVRIPRFGPRVAPRSLAGL